MPQGKNKSGTHSPVQVNLFTTTTPKQQQQQLQQLQQQQQQLDTYIVYYLSLLSLLLLLLEPRLSVDAINISNKLHHFSNENVI